jgi:hypothetical protein
MDLQSVESALNLDLAVDLLETGNEEREAVVDDLIADIDEETADEGP